MTEVAPSICHSSVEDINDGDSSASSSSYSSGSDERQTKLLNWADSANSILRSARIQLRRAGQMTTSFNNVMASEMTLYQRWTDEYDKLLVGVVKQHGIADWVNISRLLGGAFSAKQCRERWHNHVKPGINHSPLTLTEMREIERLHIQHGSSWSFIAKSLPGRTPNQIKNAWNTHLRRKAGQQNDDDDEVQIVASTTTTPRYKRQYHEISAPTKVATVSFPTPQIKKPFLPPPEHLPTALIPTPTTVIKHYDFTDLNILADVSCSALLMQQRSAVAGPVPGWYLHYPNSLYPWYYNIPSTITPFLFSKKA